jgi:hypothetical protein
MATRSTDVSMMKDCPGRFALTCFYEKEQAEASFFILGSQLHETIEVSIVMDLDLDQALTHARAGIDRELERISDAPRKIESSKRGFDSMHDDAARMLRNWFKFVHPDSGKRLEIYDEYEWPPQVEIPFMFPPSLAGTKYPVWGSVDAIFKNKASVEHALVDWKSGTSRQRTDDQLHFYQFGLSTLEVENAWFHHLDRVRKGSIIQEVGPWPGSDTIRQRILATEAIKESILEDGYVNFNPDWYCNYCPVQHVCPADGDVRNRETNLTNLSRMLQLARPMETIERVA